MTALAALLAVATPPAVQATPTLTGLMARPAQFTPNGDGITDTAEVSFTPGGAAAQVVVRVEVYDVAGAALLTTLLPDSSVTSGAPLAVTWAPGAIPDGDYRFDVTVTEAPDVLTQGVVVTTDTVTPTLDLLAAAPNPFDPTANPPAHELAVRLTVGGADAVTFVRIRQGGVSTDTLGTFVGAGVDTMTWDGRTLAGALATSGNYEVLAVVSDLAGNADTASVNFTMDHTAPVFADATPDTIQTDSFPVVLADTVTDTDRVVSVRYSVNAGSTYTAVDSVSAPGPTVQWSTGVTIPSPVRGRYSVMVEAQDALAHATTVTYVIAYDTALPVPTSSAVMSGVAHDGEHVRIRSDWNLPGLTVTADFKVLDFGYIKGVETVVEDSPGSYLVDYRVTPSNIRSSGTYVILVKASTGIVSATDSVTVQLVATELGADEVVTISANRFDPDAGETVTFAAERGTAPLRVEIFNLSGRPIRVLEGDGFLEWDGRTDGGKDAASGVYFLRVLSDGAEELRKVAVLRGGGS